MQCPLSYIKVLGVIRCPLYMDWAFQCSFKYCFAAHRKHWLFCTIAKRERTVISILIYLFFAYLLYSLNLHISILDNDECFNVVTVLDSGV